MLRKDAMAFTIARWIPFDGCSPLKGFCDVVVGNLLVIRGIRVVEGRSGLFVSMPRQQGKDGKWYDSVTPLSKEVRAAIAETVLEAYQTQRGTQPG